MKRTIKKNSHLFWDVEQVKSLYIDLITRITHTMSDRFDDHLVTLLDTST